MPEGPKKSGLPAAMKATNWVMGKLAKGAVAIAKKGYEIHKEGRDTKFEAQAVENIHNVMYSGAKHLPGHPAPPLRTSALTPDEMSKFTTAADGLTSRGIPLPTYVTSFATRFRISLKRPR